MIIFFHFIKCYFKFQECEDSISSCQHPTTSSGICQICKGNKISQGFGDNENEYENVQNKPKLEIIYPPEENHFILELKESRSFKQSNAAHEMTYKVKLNHNNPELLLNNLLPNLQALFDTLLEHMREQYGEDGVARKDTKAKRCFITIQNDDLLCLPRAIVVALWRLRYKNDSNNENLKKEYDKIRKKNSNYQKEQALLLLLHSGLPATRPGISEDIPIYENILNVGICLFSAQAGNRRVYNGNKRYSDKIFLYHYENEEGGHFDVLTEVNQLMCTSYYCDECGKGFKNSTQHKCSQWCNVCGRECQKGVEIKCESCNKNVDH